MYYKKNDILGMEGINLFEKIALFESWILYQCVMGNSFLIKAYAVRFLRCTMRDRINTCIQKISNFMWENEINLPLENHIDLDSQQINIEWTIDRTGDPNLINSNSISNINILLDEFETKMDETKIDENKKVDCSICYENTLINDMVKLNCNHEFCGFCVKKIIHSDIKNCAFCRKNIDCINVKTLEMETLFKIN
jgi:hypothetical protein